MTQKHSKKTSFNNLVNKIYRDLSYPYKMNSLYSEDCIRYNKQKYWYIESITFDITQSVKGRRL